VKPALDKQNLDDKDLEKGFDLHIDCPGCSTSKNGVFNSQPTSIKIKKLANSWNQWNYRVHLNARTSVHCLKIWKLYISDAKKQEKNDPNELDKWASIVLLASPNVPEAHFQNPIVDQYNQAYAKKLQ